MALPLAGSSASLASSMSNPRLIAQEGRAELRRTGPGEAELAQGSIGSYDGGVGYGGEGAGGPVGGVVGVGGGSMLSTASRPYLDARQDAKVSGRGSARYDVLRTTPTAYMHAHHITNIGVCTDAVYPREVPR